jgi:hypothetical protein
MEAIEAAYPDRLVEHVERLGHHASRGEVWDKAVAYQRQAGDKARGHSACREAVRCFEQALEALRHLPDSRDTSEQAIDLRLATCNALSAFTGKRQEAQEHFRTATAMYREMDMRFWLEQADAVPGR